MRCDIRLCTADELPPGKARGFVAAGQSLFVVNKARLMFAYHNRCPHRGVELNWLPDQFLDIDGELIQCSMHGALFLVESGFCVAGPCHGDKLTPIPLEVREGCVHVELHAPIAALRDPP